MRDILFEYELNPTTWVYISSLLTIGIYFKFNRVWSVRNLDLAGLIAFSPGLLLVIYDQVQLGYIWLFGVSLFFLVRLLVDTIMVRRPMLEPNLTSGGLIFNAVALLIFLTSNIITGKVNPGDLAGARRAEQLRQREQTLPGESDLAVHGPGFPLFYLLAGFANQPFLPRENDPSETAHRAALEATARTAAILGHLFVVLGLVLVGQRHFNNLQTGVAAASLYLLMPYTAQMTNCVDHVVPAALLVWAVHSYRRPISAGLLLGVAAGAIYYPLFLVPLWGGFYWRRGLTRFLTAFAAAILLMVGSLAFTSGDMAGFLSQLRQMFGWTTLQPQNVSGFWEYYALAFRMPVMAAFVALCAGLALWPAQKNLGTLLACSAAVMVGAQFWHAQGGGIYLAWYLPLLILTILRPNLEDRVAIATVRDFPWHWFRRRRRAAGM
jgi:hypothetical protein